MVTISLPVEPVLLEEEAAAALRQVFDASNPTPPWLTSTNGNESDPEANAHRDGDCGAFCGLPNAEALLALQQNSGMSAARGIVVLAEGRIRTRER
ncbi:hypothetical protein MPTK1_5g04020 [Marchantia polymorpha subsp. ruderalis]|uniref:Uncharacterized protein n=2 Tax=Marchantia polymorpha TaxID=3197 RepID=A0A176WT37_MARPO|nr:hypothetical protein AXG93_2587s1570 [Marchantia polymorpha subsp. ruderalis]PTQ29427.1 hypothetical protein MARPO_0141s0010 [Marchantia polymorpha]BBN10497.1 hypothetical protein Mp_5g04020 [Marchantia polymorpha subsp. ruderalis]|eukprot:PTQ29427.1 hypothetical protein MARPO_0141s0010 [Marchantia polymorpha]